MNGSALQLTDIVSTLMACDLLNYEVAYFAALQTVTEYELSDGELVLTSADASLVFTALPTLPGTAWQLIWLDGAEVRGDEPLTFEDRRGWHCARQRRLQPLQYRVHGERRSASVRPTE